MILHPHLKNGDTEKQLKSGGVDKSITYFSNGRIGRMFVIATPHSWRRVGERLLGGRLPVLLAL